jgi:hypothetical protein
MLSIEENRFKNSCFESLRFSCKPQDYVSLRSFIQDKLNASKNEATLNQIAEKLLKLETFAAMPLSLKYRIQNGRIHTHQEILIKAILFKALETHSKDLINQASQIEKTPHRPFQKLKDLFQITATKAAANTLSSKVGKLAIKLICALGAFAIIYFIHLALLNSMRRLAEKFIAPFAKTHLPLNVLLVIQKIQAGIQKIFSNLLLSLAVAISFDYVSKNYLAKTKWGAKIIKVLNSNVVSFLLASGNSITFSFLCLKRLYDKQDSFDSILDKQAKKLEAIHVKYFDIKKKQEIELAEKIWFSIFEKSARARQNPLVA